MRVQWRMKMSSKPSMEEILRQKMNGQNGEESKKQKDTANEEKEIHKRKTESSTKRKSINASELKAKYKDLKPNISELKENMTRDKIVDYIRDGKGRYYIGTIFLILLLAYIFGVFIGLVSNRATLNPFKAIFYSFTTGSFFTFLVIVIMAGAFIKLCMTWLGKDKQETDREFGVSDTFGSGGRATEEDAERLLIMTDTLEEQPYIVFGKDIKTGKYVGLNPDVDINHNSAVCGPQQSGKSFKYTKTNLVQLMKNGHSVCLSDPKGEMYRDMAPVFEKFGYIVKQLNVNDFFSSDSWDILADINEDNIDTFARTFVENISDNNELGTFIDQKFSLFKALCLYVLYEDKDLTDEERIVGQAYQMLVTAKSEQELDEIFLALSDSSKAKQTYINWYQGGRLKTNSLTTLSSRLQIFQKQALREVTGVKDIDLLLPCKEKCAYFIILDDQNNTYSCLISVFIKLLIEKAVWYAKRQPTGKTDRRIHLWLEEFPTIGYIPDFEKGLGTWRGYGIDITIIFQNIPQLMNRYPDNVWNAILGACSIQVCLGAYEDGDITAEHYAKMGGSGTVEVGSERRNFNKLSLLDTKAYTEVSVSKNLQQAQAIYPIEVKELILKEEMFVTIGGSKPFTFKKMGYNESKYYNTPPKPTYENIPLWLIRLKNETDFRTGYGGIFKLGRIEELPPYILERIDKWREEYLSGAGVGVSDETMPMSYAESVQVMNDIKNLNEKQGKVLLEFLDKLMNNAVDEYAGNVHSDVQDTIYSAQENSTFTSNKTQSNEKAKVVNADSNLQKETEIKEPAKEEAAGQIHKEIVFERKQPSGAGANKEQDSNDTEEKSETSILTTNGKKYVPRQEKETEEISNETESKPENKKSINFNVTFNKKK